MVSRVKSGIYEQACVEARRWIEEVTEVRFPHEDFRESLRNGVLLCKLAEKLSGINIGQLNPIPRSLAWMDNLTIFLNVCRFIGMKNSQLFRVDDLAAVRNQDLPQKIKLKEENRRLRNVLITIFWLGRLAYSLEEYQGPLPNLNAFEILINKTRPPEMVDERRNKFELDSISGSVTWPRIKRSPRRSGESRVIEGSLEYFEQMRQELIPHLNTKVKEKASMYDRLLRKSNEGESHFEEKVQRARSRTNPLPDGNNQFHEKARRAQSTSALAKHEKSNNTNKFNNYHSVGSLTRRTPIKVVQPVVQKETTQHHSKSPPINTPSEKHRPVQSFKYDNKPVLSDRNRSKSTHSRASGSRYKSDKNKEYMSVNELIQQWSSATSKEDKTTKMTDGRETNRRSLPANFATSDILPDHENKQSETRRAKPTTANVHNKSYDEQLSKTSAPTWSVEPGVQGERKHGSRDTEHHNLAEHASDTRRRSEPIKNYAAASHSNRLSSERRKGSADRSEEKDRYQKETATNEERKSQVKKSDSVDSSFHASTQKEKQRLREAQSHHHHPKGAIVHRRRSDDSSNRLPLHETQLKYTGTHLESDFHQRKDEIHNNRRKSEPIFRKYATMPTRQRKNYENEYVGKKETSTELRSGKNDWRTTSVDTRRSETKSDNPHAVSNNMQQKKPGQRRNLPTYEEAVKPLQETDINDEPERYIVKKELDHEQESTTTSSNQYITNTEKLSIDKTNKLQNQGGPVEEIVFKQRVLPVKAALEFDSLFTTEDVHEREAIFGDRTNTALKGVPAVSEPVAQRYSSVSPNELAKKPHSNVTTSTPVSHSKNKTNTLENAFTLNHDENNNRLPVYDEQIPPKSLSISQQRNSETSANTAKDVAREEANRRRDSNASQSSKTKKENEVKVLKERARLREQQKIILDEDFKERGRSCVAPDVVQHLTNQGGVGFSNVIHDNELVELVAAEEKYWKGKVEKKDRVTEEKGKKKLGKVNEKQKRVNEMLREYKLHDQKSLQTRVDYSEMTDTLRAEEEFLAQEAEKLLKQRFQEKSVKKPIVTTKLSQMDDKYEDKMYLSDELKTKSAIKNDSTERLASTHSTLNAVPTSHQMKSQSTPSSDDIDLKPEADQAYHNRPRKISRSKSPLYICSGCHLPVERDICLYVSELQSYWHEKCFRCSVCHSNLIHGRSTPKIRVMFSRIHCEKCLSNKKTGGQSTMV